MTLNLAMVISADAKGVAPATKEARREIESLGASADRSARLFAGVGASAAAANQNVAASTKLHSHEVTNLTRQFSDLGVMLASGQSPLMAMITQGPQIADIFGQRGLRSILTGVAQGITSMINPVTLTLTAITGLGYAASYVFGNFEDDVGSANKTLEKHGDLINRVVKAWSGAVPELAAYATELEGAASASERMEAARVAEAGTKAATQESFKAAVGDLNAMIMLVPAAQQAFTILGGKVSVGAQTVEDFQRVIDPLNEVLKTQTSPALEEVVKKLVDLQLETFRAAERIKRLREEAGGFAPGQRDDINSYLRDPSRPTLLLPDSAPTPDRRVDPYFADAERVRRSGRTEKSPADKAREYLTTQEEQLARLRLERQLIGASNVERERAIGLLEAEQVIRKLGISSHGKEADLIRQNAKEHANLADELGRTERAYERVQRASENMVDSLVDRLASGDIKGALAGLAKDLASTALEMAVKNPLKEALTGKDLPTLDDLEAAGGFVNDCGALFEETSV